MKANLPHDEDHPPQMPQCILCVWYKGLEPDVGPVCLAFMKGIPTEIWENDFDHRKPFMDVKRQLWDKGLQFRQSGGA